MRVAGDVLVGNPPFAELPRWGDSYAVGGQSGVRGVPAQRYYGKVKVIGNLEARAHFFNFRFLGKDLTLGGAAFADGGRVWADTTPHPELDGTGLGIKYGLGGGAAPSRPGPPSYFARTSLGRPTRRPSADT